MSDNKFCFFICIVVVFTNLFLLSSFSVNTEDGWSRRLKYLLKLVKSGKFLLDQINSYKMKKISIQYPFSEDICRGKHNEHTPTREKMGCVNKNN